MIQIGIDRQAQLVRLKLDGFWSSEDFETFKHGFMKALRDLGTAPSQHMIIVDLRDTTLQTQELIATAQAFMTSFPNKARRIALVANSALSRMQTKRLLVRPGISLFMTMEEAEGWLADARDGGAASLDRTDIINSAF